MGQIVSTFANQPAVRQTVTLGESPDGVQFGLRLTWRDRTASWYVDLWAADGTPIMLGQRMSPGWSVGLGLTPAGKPAGQLYVRGPDEYVREDLGDTLLLVFYPDDEIPEADTTDSGLTITIP